MENPSILLEKGVNYDKYNLDNIIEWWKRKSFSRWTKLKEENRLKTELEIYTTESLKDKTFEMIR